MIRTSLRQTVKSSMYYSPTAQKGGRSISIFNLCLYFCRPALATAQTLSFKGEAFSYFSPMWTRTGESGTEKKYCHISLPSFFKLINHRNKFPPLSLQSIWTRLTLTREGLNNSRLAGVEEEHPPLSLSFYFWSPRLIIFLRNRRQWYLFSLILSLEA